MPLGERLIEIVVVAIGIDGQHERLPDLLRRRELGDVGVDALVEVLWGGRRGGRCRGGCWPRRSRRWQADATGDHHKNEQQDRAGSCAEPVWLPYPHLVLLALHGSLPWLSDYSLNGGCRPFSA